MKIINAILLLISHFTEYPVKYLLQKEYHIQTCTSFSVPVSFSSELPWYIYAPTGNNTAQGMVETNVIFQLPKGISRKGKLQIPKPEIKYGHEVYQGKDIVYQQEFAVAKDLEPGNYIIKAKIIYQACNDKICLPPMSETVDIKVIVEGENANSISTENEELKVKVEDEVKVKVKVEGEMGDHKRNDKKQNVDEEIMQLQFTAMDGRKVDLKELKGKLVLVDCWATWCRPCIAEFENLKKLYAKYRDKGFEIIGISMDEASAEKLVKDVVAKKKLPWPQWYEAKGFEENSFGKQYGVASLPAVFLIEKDGSIIDKDARGEKLEKLIQKYLGLD